MLLAKSLLGVLLTALILSSAVAQQKAAPRKAQPKPAQSKPGAISGRVFAITGSGDLKPARMAKVYVLYFQFLNVAQATDQDAEEARNSVGMAWLKESGRAAQQYLEELKSDGGSWTDSISCRKRLLSYDRALMETLKWGEVENLTGQILRADADEEGNFKIGTVRPGRYILVVRGRTGLNDALWSKDDIAVESGAETAVKLASPERACLSIQ